MTLMTLVESIVKRRGAEQIKPHVKNLLLGYYQIMNFLST